MTKDIVIGCIFVLFSFLSLVAFVDEYRSGRWKQNGIMGEYYEVGLWSAGFSVFVCLGCAILIFVGV
jgi:hypothetical protein